MATIVVVGGIKGGSGKTTLATNFTYLTAVKHKKRTLLVDADEQKSATDWVNQRIFNSDNEMISNVKTPWTTINLSGARLRQELYKLSLSYDTIIVDLGGRDTTSQRAALTVADYFIAPFQPRSFDIWTVGSIVRLFEDVILINPKLKCYAVLNRADPRGCDNDDARDILSEHSHIINLVRPYIVCRKAFPNSAANGLAVHEHNPVDAKAIVELEEVYDSISIS